MFYSLIEFSQKKFCLHFFCNVHKSNRGTGHQRISKIVNNLSDKHYLWETMSTFTQLKKTGGLFFTFGQTGFRPAQLSVSVRLKWISADVRSQQSLYCESVTYSVRKQRCSLSRVSMSSVITGPIAPSVGNVCSLCPSGTSTRHLLIHIYSPICFFITLIYAAHDNVIFYLQLANKTAAFSQHV